MAVLKGWIGQDSGLACFRLEGAGTLTAGGRIVARSSGGVLFCCDPLAPAGLQVRYEFRGASIVLRRRALGGPHGALVSDVRGRGVLVDVYEDTGDRREFSASVRDFDNGALRWGRGEREGESRFVLDSPERLHALQQVLEHPGVVLICLNSPAEGVEGVRAVSVRRVSYERTGTDGSQVVDVQWRLAEFPDPGAGAAGVAPALTWGECEAAGLVWGAWSVEDAHRTVGGMPL